MKSLIVANWKMNPGTWKEAKKLFEETKRMSQLLKVPIIVAPPAIFLRDIASQKRGKNVALAAQNVHFEMGGAFTGDISVSQVHDAKAHYSLVGHAERRAAGESEEDTRKKIAALFAHGLTPIFCVGEKLRDEQGSHFATVRAHLLAGIADISPAQIAKLIVAYEPVWAIGAPEPMRPHDMHEMSIFIRKTLVEHGGEAGHKTMILYGGAVDGGNARAMLETGGVSGFLVGRASVDSARMSELLRAVAKK